MHKLLLLCLLLVPTRGLFAAPNITAHTLNNGMRILLVERRGDPTLVCGWVAKVGSAQDGLESSGLAHMLEHMMFKGTPTLGTKDAAKDQLINRRQDELQLAIRAEMEALRDAQRRGLIPDATDPKARSPRLQELLQSFEQTVQEQRTLLVKNELQSIYARAGATRVNAGTGSDWTVYLGNIPANKLELWCWLESDRLREPVFREFYTEREVVKEERRSSIESEPGGEALEAFGALIWQAHPYQWCTFSAIGWPGPLGSLTREQAQQFFRTYYAPENLTAIVIGDFEGPETLHLLERYFGRIPKGGAAPPLVSLEAPQPGEQRLKATISGTPRLVVALKAVPDLHRDAPVLRVLERVLNGKGGRLEQGLIQDQSLAVSARARLDLRKFGGLLHLEATAANGSTLADLETGLDRVLHRLAQEPVAEDELIRARNQALAARLEESENPRSLLWALAQAETSGSYRDWEALPTALARVTAEDLRRVAAELRDPRRRNVLLLEGPSPKAAPQEMPR